MREENKVEEWCLFLIHALEEVLLNIYNNCMEVEKTM